MVTDGPDQPDPVTRRGWARSAPWLLRRVSQRYGSVVVAHLRDAQLAGLPRPGYWLLMALASGARDATQLVDASRVTKQAVSKVVDTLVTEGFVLRKTNEGDRRRTDLVLTAKGLRTVEVIRAALRTAERTFIDEVGAAAWNTTVATLAALALAPDDLDAREDRVTREAREVRDAREVREEKEEG